MSKEQFTNPEFWNLLTPGILHTPQFVGDYCSIRLPQPAPSTHAEFVGNQKTAVYLIFRSRYFEIDGRRELRWRYEDYSCGYPHQLGPK
jgi:hypothetical protein